MPHYFLTGATGVVGSAFLQKIAARQERVTVLLRALSAGAAEARLKQLIAYCEISALAAQQIDAVPGDLYQPGLGLAPSDFKRLAGNCTHIVHCAGNVHMNLPLAEARQQTLSMASGVIALLEASSKAHKMEFVSTVGVGGHTAGEIPEEWITHRRAFHNSYEAAKAEAEEMVRKKIAAGLPITVHRPSMVVGDSQTGKNISFQVFYYLCEFLSGGRTQGVIPQVGNMRLDIVPADYVASLLDWSSRQQQRPATILHACSSKEGAIALRVLVGEVHRIFTAHGRHPRPTRMLPMPLFKLLLGLAKPWVAPRDRRALDALPFFFAYLKEDQSFANQRTVQLLQADHIVLPKVEEYLDRVLGYYLMRERKLPPLKKMADRRA